MPICRLLRITCHKQEDNTGRDHPYIRVNGQRVWGPKGMEVEQTREIQRNVPFNHRAKVRLYEEDGVWPWDPDDFLGEHEVTRAYIGEGEQEFTFAEDDANYSIWIEVFADPGR